MTMQEKMLETAVEVARAAGRTFFARYHCERTLKMKGFRDPVTHPDTATEGLISERIRARFPDHAILSEAGGGERIAGGYTWVVDPLEGTTNYTHHHCGILPSCFKKGVGRGLIR